MAEALAIVGLASALIQFIDFSGKVLRQLRRLETDVAGIPAVFQNVRSRLPLMVDLVKKIMLRMDAGLIDQSSQDMMLPVIRGCTIQAEQLDGLIAKALPQKNESTWARGRKAVIGVLIESEVERIDAAFKSNFDLLAQAGTFHLVDGDGAENRRRGAGGSGLFNFLGSNVHVTVQGSATPATDDLFLKAEGAPPAYQSPPLPQEQQGISAPAKPFIFMVPFNRDSNFLGRSLTLDLLSQRFESQPSVALAGLGGIG